MHADTESYTALQNAFYEKAAEDCSIVLDRVKMLRSEFPSATKSLISLEDLTIQMCKTAQQIRVIRYSKIEDELKGPLDPETVEMIREALTEHPDEIPEDLSNSDPNPNVEKIAMQKPVIWYLMLRAFDKFTTLHGRNPGFAVSDEIALAADATELLKILHDTMLAFGLGDVSSQLITISHAKEIARAGGGELHTVAAVMGGVAAQEAVKILTGLFVPQDNTFVYNGIIGNAGTFNFKGIKDAEMSM
jgi:amyloid beta precursor protein binding protein 1